MYIFLPLVNNKNTHKTTIIMSTNPVQSDQYTTNFTSTCTGTFNRTPFHWQIEIGSSILRLQGHGIGAKQLCIRPTGGGKTLLFTAVAYCLKGVTLVITPLLSLGADQMLNLHCNTKDDSSVTAFHLDEIPQTFIQRLLDGIQNANTWKMDTVAGLSVIMYLAISAKLKATIHLGIKTMTNDNSGRAVEIRYAIWLNCQVEHLHNVLYQMYLHKVWEMWSRIGGKKTPDTLLNDTNKALDFRHMFSSSSDIEMNVKSS
jgi:hypothetical protein